MARYNFTYKKSDQVLYYDESLPEEDKMDKSDGGDTYCSFTGNGFLKFWSRCKTNVARNQLEGGHGTWVDTFTGETKEY